MQKLAVVEMQDQRLAAAGSHPAGQFGQVGFGKLPVGRLARRFGGVALAHKGIQVGQQLGAGVEIAVQDNFRVKRGQILKIAQGNRLGAAAVDDRQMSADVLVIALQVFGCDCDLTAAADQMVIEETPPRSVEPLGGAFVGIGQQVFIAFVTQQAVEPSDQYQSIFQFDVLRDGALRDRLHGVRSGKRGHLTLPSAAAEPAAPA